MTPLRHVLKDMASARPMVILCIFALAGCQSLADYREFSDYRGGDLTRPQVKTVEVQLVHPVASAGNGSFDREARVQLDRFLAGARPGHYDRLDVRYPGSQQDLATRAEAVRAYLAFRRFEATVLPDANAKGVSVVLHRHQVTLPSCPDWTKPGGRSADNQPGSNWGCATAVNLGLMVANPSDLTRGRSAGPADADRAVLGIQRYRTGETTPLIDTSTGAPASGGGAGGSGGGS